MLACFPILPFSFPSFSVSHLSFLKDHCCYSSLSVSSPLIFPKCLIDDKSYIVLYSILPTLTLSFSKSHSRNRKERSGSALLAITGIMCTISSPSAQAPTKGVASCNAFEIIKKDQRNHFPFYLYNRNPIDECM